MSAGIEKTMQTMTLVVGAFLITVVVVTGGALLYQNRDAKLELSAPSWLSAPDPKPSDLVPHVTVDDHTPRYMDPQWQKQWGDDLQKRMNTMPPTTTMPKPIAPPRIR